MRVMKPDATPVIELQSVQMPTKFGKKPRPFFKITGWRMRDPGEQQQLVDQTDDVVEVNEFNDDAVF
jgi:hypothetical protein